MIQVPDLSRRYLLMGGASAVVAGVAFSESLHAKGALKTWPLGVQLWTVNAELKTDIPGTLKALKVAGYEVVETAGTVGHTPAEFLGMIHDAGLKCRSAHTSMPDLIASLDQKIADAVALGVEYLVCSSPKPPVALDPKEDWVKAMVGSMTLDAWKFNADQLARIAPEVAKAGLKFAYHNHPMEFKDLGGGQTGYDIMLRAVDPNLLRLEMDLGWVEASGHNPVAMMKKHAGRVDLLHVKDMVKDPTAPIGYRSVAVGEGLIDWPAVFKTAHRIGVKGFFVEQEPPYLEPVMTSLAKSRNYLKRL